MALTAKQTGETREPIPAGNYFGAIIGVYDLGTQPGGQYGPKHQILLQFELHRKKGVCRDKEGRTLLISKFYSLAFGPKSELRPDVEAILNRSFTEEEARDGYDVTQLVDCVCRLTIKHEPRKDGKGMRDVISSISPCDEDDPEISPESDSIVYDDITADYPDGMPEWIQRLASKSAERDGNDAPPARAGGNGKNANGKPANGKASRKPAREPGSDDEDDDTPF